MSNYVRNRIGQIEILESRVERRRYIYNIRKNLSSISFISFVEDIEGFILIDG